MYHVLHVFLLKSIVFKVCEHKRMNIRPSNYRSWLRHCASSRIYMTVLALSFLLRFVPEMLEVSWDLHELFSGSYIITYVLFIRSLIAESTIWLFVSFFIGMRVNYADISFDSQCADNVTIDKPASTNIVDLAKVMIGLQIPTLVNGKTKWNNATSIAAQPTAKSAKD